MSASSSRSVGSEMGGAVSKTRWEVVGRRSVLASFALGALLFAGAPDADAQSAPKAEVLVIHGTQCDKPTVDPAIGEVPPLKYNCYKLLEKKVLPLTKGQASATPLPNGRTFQITLNDVTPDKRFKVATAISQPDGKGFLELARLTAEPNKRFTVGGWAHQNGAIVLSIRVVP